MSRHGSNYPPELRERAVRMVAEVKGDYPSEWAAIAAVASKLGIGSAETLRKWVRRAEVDAGDRPGITTEERGDQGVEEGERRAAARQRDPQGGLGFLRGGARPPTPVLVKFIDGHKGRFGVAPICRVLTEHGIKIAPSTYYDARGRAASKRILRDKDLKIEIARVHGENYGVYGPRKVWLQLNREGIEVARCTVERSMNVLGLQGIRRGKRWKTTLADPAATRPPDLVKRQFNPPAPNALWVADFTYVATWAGVVYALGQNHGAEHGHTGPSTEKILARIRRHNRKAH